MTEKASKTPVADDFLTSQEAAMLLGVSLRTVQLWVDSRILRAWKTAGGHRRVARSSVDELLKQRHREVTTGDNTLSIVIIEDEPVQRELYQIKFEEWGLPVEIIMAEDGFEGLLEIGHSKPDVIISDLCMPGMDGFQVIRTIMSNEEMQHTKIIAITSLNEDDIAENGGLPAKVLVLHKTASFNILEKLIHDIYVLKYGQLSRVGAEENIH